MIAFLQKNLALLNYKNENKKYIYIYIYMPHRTTTFPKTGRKGRASSEPSGFCSVFRRKRQRFWVPRVGASSRTSGSSAFPWTVLPREARTRLLLEVRRARLGRRRRARPPVTFGSHGSDTLRRGTPTPSLSRPGGRQRGAEERRRWVGPHRTHVCARPFCGQKGPLES